MTWRALYTWPYCLELYSKEEQLDIEEGAGGGAASGASAEVQKLDFSHMLSGGDAKRAATEAAEATKRFEDGGGGVEKKGTYWAKGTGYG